MRQVGILASMPAKRPFRSNLSRNGDDANASLNRSSIPPATYMPPVAPNVSARSPAIDPRNAQKWENALTHWRSGPSMAERVSSSVGRRQRRRGGAVDCAECFIEIDEACATEHALGRDMAPTLPKDL